VTEEGAASVNLASILCDLAPMSGAMAIRTSVAAMANAA
jgi:hypothetical protein